MRKIVVFCSNPVDGGTAKVFAEMSEYCNALGKDNNYMIIPCVNKNNKVNIYNSIEGLERIDVYSEEEVCGILKEGKNIIYRVFRRIYRNVKYYKQIKINIENMRHFLCQNKIHTVIVHNGGYIGDDLCNQMLKASFLENIPIRIMVLHNDFSKSILQKWYYKKYDFNLCKYATKIETVSEYTKNRLLKNSFIKKNIGVIYNGIKNENNLSEEEKEKNIDYNKNVYNIGMIGNFMYNKGQLHLIKAAEMLRDMVDFQFVITIIGNVYDKTYYKECCDYIYQNNLNEIIKIFHGIYNASEYTSLFQFTVVPSLEDESFGLISVESMKNGVPVIAYACGGIPEVIKDRRDGIVVDVGNINLLVNAMYTIMDDEVLRIQLGIQAQEDYIKKFTLKAMAERYLDVLEIRKVRENE